MKTVSMEPDAEGGELLAANVTGYCVSCGALAKQFGGLKMSNGSKASDPPSRICVANIASGLRGLRFSEKKKTFRAVTCGQGKQVRHSPPKKERT